MPYDEPLYGPLPPLLPLLRPVLRDLRSAAEEEVMKASKELRKRNFLHKRDTRPNRSVIAIAGGCGLVLGTTMLVVLAAKVAGRTPLEWAVKLLGEKPGDTDVTASDT